MTTTSRDASMHLRATILLLLICSIATPCQAQVVEVGTPLGDIYMEMRPVDAPISVDNFLKYITDGDYADSFIHRSAFLFDSGVDVIQGGGFTIDPGGQFGLVPTDPPILNEPGISNLRGTVAMARSTGVNSATSQWYINLNDANSVLDTNNEGFTVFADVVIGMDVADAIHNLQRVNIGGALTQLPLLDNAEPPTVDYDEVVLTTYRIITPGDFNEDGVVDAADFTVWRDNLGITGLDPYAMGDGTGDGEVTAADYDVWRSQLGVMAYGTNLPGDYNNDGTVDAADYVVWRDSQGATGLIPGSLGDGNGDGEVTQADYDVWRTNFAQTTSASAISSGGIAIPEPSAVCIAALLVAGLAAYSRSRKKPDASACRLIYCALSAGRF